MEWGLDRRTKEHIFSTSGCFSFYGQKNKRTYFFNEGMFPFYGQKNRRTCFLYIPRCSLTFCSFVLLSRIQNLHPVLILPELPSYLNPLAAEINQQPVVFASRSQIVHQLAFMNRVQPLHCFQFNNNLIFHQDIRPELPHHVISIIHMDRHLRIRKNSPLTQFNQHRLLIHGLQKTRCKTHPHLIRTLDNHLDKFLCSHIFCSYVLLSKNMFFCSSV